MVFEYDRDTREFYREDAVAREYHDAFTKCRGWRGLRFRFVAARERRIVRYLLNRVPHQRVLDCPAGTGKMASVFIEAGADVTSGDISPAMLSIAKATYRKCEYDKVSFAVLDLENATKVLGEVFDVTVCVRLMQRVPFVVKEKMLREISMLSPHAIVSFAIRNRYHDCRTAVRSRIFGGEDVGLETRTSRREVEELIGRSHRILERRPVARGLSSEWVYLLVARDHRPAS